MESIVIKVIPILSPKLVPVKNNNKPPIDPLLIDKSPLAKGLFLFLGWFLSDLRSNKSLNIYTLDAVLLKAKNANNDWKNKALSKNWKVNIINEGLNLNINKITNIRDVSINSKKIKANDLFFGIKGRKFDGNKFAIQAVKKGCYAFVDKKYHKHKRIIRVKNS